MVIPLLEETFSSFVGQSGRSKIIIIPHFLIKEKRIDPTKEYKVTLKEIIPEKKNKEVSP